MAKVRIRVTRQNSKYKEAIKGYEDKARRVVAYGLNEVRDIAVKGIAGGNKSGITYTRRGVSHTASAAGEYLRMSTATVWAVPSKVALSIPNFWSLGIERGMVLL